MRSTMLSGEKQSLKFRQWPDAKQEDSMISAMKKIDRWLNLMLEWIVIAMLVLMVIVVSAQLDSVFYLFEKLLKGWSEAA